MEDKNGGSEDGDGVTSPDFVRGRSDSFERHEQRNEEASHCGDRGSGAGGLAIVYRVKAQHMAV